MMRKTALLAALLALAPPEHTGSPDPRARPASLGGAQEPEDPPVYMGRAFLFRADLDEGRALGWAPAEAEDAELLASIAATLKARVRNSGRFVEGQVASEPERLFSVTFVGPMAEVYETWLREAFSMPCHLALAAVATDQDLSGTSLEAERRRLAEWLAADPTRHVREHARVPRAEGGPPPGLAWAAGVLEPDLAADGAGESGASAAVAAVPLWVPAGEPLRRAELAAPLRYYHHDEGLALFLQPGPELAARLEDLRAGRPGGAWALTLDGRVLGFPGLESPTERLDVDTELGEGTLRAVVLAHAGEPLPAPLAFEGFGKRPLENVRHHVPGDDD